MKIEDLEGHDEDDVVPGKQQLVTVEAKRAVVLAGARVLFYPTLLYNVFRNKLQSDFRWWDPVDQYLLLGAVPFPKDVPRLKQLGVGAVITLNEPYETLVPSSLYTANGIEHLVIPTRDYLFAPSFVDINRAVQFIQRNACCGRTTYVHCKAGRGRSTTIVLCYLVEHKNMAPADALEYVRSIRPRVALAPSQWKAVQEYSKRWLDASAHSPSGNVVLVTKADIQLDTSACSPGDAVLMTNADLRMDTRAHSSSGDAVLITKADLQLDASAQSPSGDKIFITNADLQMDTHSPSGDAVLITKADLRLDTSAHSPYGDAVLITNADLRMDTHSPSGEAVLITKADLEGYYNSCDDAGNGKQLTVLRGIKATPMMARLSCLFASLKVSGAGGPVTRQLSEARAY